jgi:hypothetical protein
MKSPKIEHLVQPMTVEAASDYARRIHGFLEAGVRDPEELDFSYDAFERQYGLGRWTIEHLRKGRAKTCDVGIFARMRAAYIDLCERQVTKLQHQIAIERATGDDTLEDLETEARALAAKIQAKKAGLRLSRPSHGREGAE